MSIFYQITWIRGTHIFHKSNPLSFSWKPADNSYNGNFMADLLFLNTAAEVSFFHKTEVDI